MSKHDSSLNAPRLFHFSEEANIGVFSPRPSPSILPGVESDVVFAIEERLQHHYWLPRECPRVCIHATEETTVDDCETFSTQLGSYVMYIEESWIERINHAVLWRYEFNTHDFRCIDNNAGYWVADSVQHPLRVETMTSLLDLLRELEGLELRIVDRLHPIAEDIRSSTLAFSCIRMRNALSA